MDERHDDALPHSILLPRAERRASLPTIIERRRPYDSAEERIVGISAVEG